MATDPALQLETPREAAEWRPSADEVLPVTNLAALLDRFTQSVTDPQAHTVGDFAGTVQAIHGELALLARQFGAVDDLPLEAYSFDDIFPAPVEHNEPGIAASEELEHLCRTLSR